MSDSTPALPGAALRRRHLRLGWWALLLFVLMGSVLETLHGVKSSWYLGVGQETRRLMLTLAHAHGTLIAVLHIVFAFTADRVAHEARAWRVSSLSLTGALVLVPGGFLLGGLVTYGGDPGLGILLLPVGALLLLISIGVTAWQVTRSEGRD